MNLGLSQTVEPAIDIRLVGAYLRKLRHNKGISQWALSHATGIKRGTISNYELSEARPPIDVLWVLIKANDGSLAELESVLERGEL